MAASTVPVTRKRAGYSGARASPARSRPDAAGLDHAPMLSSSGRGRPAFALAHPDRSGAHLTVLKSRRETGWRDLMANGWADEEPESG